MSIGYHAVYLGHHASLNGFFSLGSGVGVIRWRSSQPPRDRSEARQTIQVDPLNFEHGLYGTRLSTVVLIKRSGDVVFIERDRWKVSPQDRPILADPSSQRVFRFRLESIELSS